MNSLPLPAPAFRRGILILAGSIAALLAGHSAVAASATWSATPTNGFWEATGAEINWDAGAGAFPGALNDVANTDTATFLTSSTTTVLVGSSIPNATPLGIGSIAFGATAGPSAFTLGTTVGNALLLGNGGSISIAAGSTGLGASQTVNAPLVLEPASIATAGAYTFSNDSALAGSILKLGGAIAGGTTSAGVTLNLTGASTSANEISGIISNGSAATGLAVTKALGGTWILSNANTYTGVTTISGGTLVMKNPQALGLGSVSFGTGSTLDLATDGGDTAYNMSAGSGTSMTIVADVKTGTVGINHTLGSLAIGGSTTAGGTKLTITRGSSVLSGTPSVTLGSVSLSSGPTGTITTFNPTTASLSIGTVSAPGGTKTLNMDGTATGNSVTGAISDGAGVVNVTKTNTGAWTLLGSNTYTGTTTVSAGVLILQNGSALGATSGATTVSSGAALQLQGGITVGAEALTIGGGGETANPNSGAIRNISGDNTYNGTITISGSTRFTADSGKMTLNNIVTATGRTAVFNGGGDLVLAGVVSGAGALSKDAFFPGSGQANGSLGTLSVTGANSYTGSTTAGGGTLALTGVNGSVRTSGGVTISGDGVLKLDNTAAVNNTDRLNNTGTVTMTGGTLNFSNTGGAVNYSETTGALSISAGQNTITSSQADVGQTSALAFASYARTAGLVNFLGAGLGAADGRNVIKITAQAAGNLSGATYNTTDFAAYDPTLGVTAATYTDIAARGPGAVIADSATSDVRIQSAGTSGNITLGAATTTITALLQNSATAATVDTAGSMLRTSAIMIAPGQQALTIGTAPDSGSLTSVNAGDALALINHSSNTLTVNSSIPNNTNSSVVVSGPGVTTLAGTNTYTGSTTENGGTLNLTGSNAFGAGTVLVGSLGGNSVLNIPAGGNVSLSGNGNTTGIFRVGIVSGSNGALNVSGGTLTSAATADSDNQLLIGAVGGGYGALNVSAGSLSTVRLQIGGGNGTAGTGVGLLSGTGTVTASGFILLGRSNGATGVLTVAPGATLNHAGSAQNLALGYSGGRAELNLMGGTIDNTGRDVTIRQGGTATNGNVSTGITNLNAGTLTTNSFTNNAGTAYLNFNGGTLRASLAAATLIPNTMTGVYLNSGGAVIDTNGLAVTVSAGLLAPTGSGVSTVPVVNGGSGYIGAPYVSLNGDGFGATAIANMVDDGTGKGTLKIASITVTNRGNNYTATPTVSLVGGGATSAATLGAITTASNISGGLTKSGVGTLTLTGTSTYTGTTTVDGGTLLVSGVSGSISGSTVAVTGGTLGGSGGTVGATTVSSGGTLAPGESIGTLNFASSLTLSGNAVFEIDKTGFTLTADLANVTAGTLTLGGTLNVTATGAALVNGDTFNLFDAPAFAGSFATLNLPVLDPGLAWKTSNLAVDGTLMVVPEPGVAASLLGGVGLLLGLRRRRA